MKRFLLVLKGMAMGFADVVPGVSGGTMALVLGIYVSFIEGIKSVNFRWGLPLFAWIASGFSKDKRAAFWAPVMDIHWGFLVPLGIGIVMAFGVGSKVIPDLMDTYPTIMRAFFMGLILASIIVPWQQMPQRGAREVAVIAGFAAAFFVIVGTHSEPSVSWKTYASDEAMAFEDFTRAFPSVHAPAHLYCPNDTENDNVALRAAITASAPETAAELDEICAELAAASGDLAAYAEVREARHLGRKHPLNPFNEVLIPAETPVNVAAPAYWFVFAAGFLAICAMVLPGISGSFILLILGAYYFMLSAIKGAIITAAHLQFPETQIAYVVLFSFGALLGLMAFSRILSYLFKHYTSVTLAALVGIMLGSLRVIWPFKIGDAHIGMVRNVMPGEGELMIPLIAMVVGFGLVASLAIFGEVAELTDGEPEDA